jgi:hypothetical protein
MPVLVTKKVMLGDCARAGSVATSAGSATATTAKHARAVILARLGILSSNFFNRLAGEPVWSDINPDGKTLFRWMAPKRKGAALGGAQRLSAWRRSGLLDRR